MKKLFALAILLSASAFADNLLYPVLFPLDRLNIAENYANFYGIINFFIYLVIFVGLTKTILRERLGHHAAIGVGAALAIALIWFEYQQGINLLVYFGTIAFLMILLLLGVFLFLMIKSMSEKTSMAACIAYCAVFLLFTSLDSRVTSVLEEVLGPLLGFLWIAWLVCLVRIVMGIPDMFKDVGDYLKGDSGKDGEKKREGKKDKDGKKVEEGGKKGGEGGKSGGGEEAKPSFKSDLEKIHKYLEEYKRIFKQEFMPACTDVLQTNYDHIHSGGYYGAAKPPVSDIQWNKVITGAQKLADCDSEINTTLEGIKSHDRFSDIIHEEKVRMLHLISERTSTIKEMQGYYVDFLDKYKKGRLPGP